MKTKLLTLLVIASLLTSFAVIFPVRAFNTKLKVEPVLVEKYSDVDAPGISTFTVSIIAENVEAPGFYGYEFVLSWAAGVINCTTEVLNLAVWPSYNGPWVSTPIDNVAGEYHQSITAKSPSTPVTGTFWLANLTFVIVAAAPYGGFVSSPLTLGIAPGYTDYCLLDQSSGEIPHDFIDGLYKYYWKAPLTNPQLYVSPASYTASSVGEEFDIQVKIRNVDPGWLLAGTEFLLFYNTTILDAMSVNQGTFFEPFFYPLSPPQTFWYGDSYGDSGMIRVAYTMMDIPNMLPPYTPPDGLIATIHFKATLQGLFPVTYSCPLDVQIDAAAGMTGYFINKFGDEIPDCPEAADGYYSILPKILGGKIDVFTQYPFPFGGQNLYQPSDMFWPQKEVELYANVTYNDWPVQNKMVAFEIRKPNGEIADIIYAISNETGYAHTSYRIPWPCFNTSSIFGVWTVTATVDLFCKVVNDTLQFHFDYLVHWIKVETDKLSYAHGETIVVTIDWGSHSQMPREVLFTVSVHDSVNQPIGVAAGWQTAEGTIFCQLKNQTIVLEIPIPKWAMPGIATVHVGALSDWPSLGGSPWAPEYDPAPTVNILAI